MGIMYDKKKLNWDDYIPAILFAYRTSVNDTTSYSPFFLETGREPQLPMGNMFPDLRPKEQNENFVQDILDKLEFAFREARRRQQAVSDKNKERKPTQHQPSFVKGDWLLVFGRSAKEGRLELKDEDGKAIPLPEKMRNQFHGPYRMLAWSGKRNCILDVKGKKQTFNVTRLIKKDAWSDAIRDTDEPIAPQKPSQLPEIGDFIVIPTDTTDAEECLLDIGKVLEIRDPDDIVVHWYGNFPQPQAHRICHAGSIKTRRSTDG